MRPIHEISAEECQGLEGVVFDIDDTLTCDGRLEAVAYDALWRLVDAGLVLVAVTGRPLGWVDVVAWQWPIHFAVGENGSGWTWRDERVLQRGYFDGDAARDAYNARLGEVEREVLAQLPFARLTNDHLARRCDLAFDVNEQVHLSESEREAMRALIEKLGFKSVFSSVHAHVVPGEWDKAKGVVKGLRVALGLDAATHPERWLFVGDSGNDAAAFSYFPLSAGVANVQAYLDQLPRAPKYVASCEYGEGFAEIADIVLARRGRGD